MKLKSPEASIKHLVTILFLITAFAISATTTKAQSQQNEKTEVEIIETIKGDLHLIKHIEDGYANQVSLKLKDKVLLKAPYQYISVEGKFGQPPTLFLVFLGTDSLTCIGKFVVVDLSTNRPQTTEEFGNCSDAPKTVYANKSLTLTFPDGTNSDSKYKIGSKEIWRYSKEKLRKTK